MVTKGRYSLYKNNPKNNEKEVFDFASDTLNFTSLSDAKMDKVSLATIDSLTTCFFSHYDMINHLDKENIHDRDEMIESSTINYKSNSTGNIESLEVVYDDETLHTIAKHAKGGKVDFSCDVTNDTFREIYRELRYGDGNLLTTLFHPESRTYNVNAHNKEILKKIPFIDSKEDERQICLFRHNFSNYREYRALYLAYKKHKMQKEMNKKDNQRNKKLVIDN